jgi:SAM-dependent methyltransferase
MTVIAFGRKRATPYNSTFFANQAEGALRSAQIVAPIVVELVSPATVVDIGCGQGAWLRAFQENGVEELKGYDGPWVDSSRFFIDPRFFCQVDLCSLESVLGCFDLALCLEVGEHLPARIAPQLVKLLTNAAPLVLFSAAIPGQGGTRHINEQWPDYWKAIFARRGFRRLDPIRRKILHDNQVEWWYRQNIYLYAAEEAIANSAVLKEEERLAQENLLDHLHPDILARYTSLRGLLTEVPRAGWRAVRRIIRF